MRICSALLKINLFPGKIPKIKDTMDVAIIASGMVEGATKQYAHFVLYYFLMGNPLYCDMFIIFITSLVTW